MLCIMMPLQRLLLLAVTKDVSVIVMIVSANAMICITLDFISYVARVISKLIPHHAVFRVY